MQRKRYWPCCAGGNGWALFVADGGDGFRAEAVAELLEVEAGWLNVFAFGLDYSAFEQRVVVFLTGGWHRGGFLIALVADGPVDDARRILHGDFSCGVVPQNSPADGPAVAASHRAAVHQVDASAGDFAVVDEEAGGPALMRFDVAVAEEAAVEDDDGALGARLGDDVEAGVALAGAAVEEDLCAVEGEVGGLGCAGDGGGLGDVDLKDSHALGVGADGDGVGGVFEGNGAEPGVDEVVHLDAVECGVVVEVDGAVGGNDAEVF